MRKRIWVLMLVLCLACLWGCQEESAPETTIQTQPEALPVAQVELSETYALPVKEALLEQNWLLTGAPTLLITHRLPEDHNVPVILVGGSAQADQVYALAYNRAQLCSLQADQLPAMPNGGDLNRDGVITYAVISPTGSGYADACTAALAETGWNVQRLKEENCLDDQTVGQQVASRILAAYGKDLDVLFCGSEALSMGAAEAVKDAGRVVSKDLILLTVGQQIPQYSGTVYEDPQTMIDAVLALAEQLHSGSTPPAQTLIPLTSVINE